MPLFLHPTRKSFPPLKFASEDGLLAIGGDLSTNRLLLAYANGIFPWYDADSPILWWCPPDRCILHPNEIHIPKSLRKSINSRKFTVTLDTAFADVIRACSHSPRPGQNGSWIVPEMIQAYCAFHRAGYAHSVEVWQDARLVGGLYGVALGGAFFGESMFFAEPDASKVGFVWLARLLAAHHYSLIDCQQVTHHLLRFGAQAVPREVFLHHLTIALQTPTRIGQWSMPEDFFPL